MMVVRISSTDAGPNDAEYVDDWRELERLAREAEKFLQTPNWSRVSAQSYIEHLPVEWANEAKAMLAEGETPEYVAWTICAARSKLRVAATDNHRLALVTPEVLDAMPVQPKEVD